MTDPGNDLTKVEQRLLSELLTLRATLPTKPLASAGRPSRLRPPHSKPGGASHARSRELASPRTQSAVIAGAVLTLLAVVVVSVVSSSTRALAAAPRPLAYHIPPPGAPSGQHELLDLAAAAASQPAPPANHPRYAYTETSGWYLNSRIDGRLTTSTVVPTTTQSWLAPDGSGRVRTIADEPSGSRYVISDLRPGSGHPLLPLTNDEAVLASELAQGHPSSDGPVERFVALSDLATQQPIPGDVESVILRLLASTPGLINTGTVIDRAGRPGVAVSIDSAYSGLLTRYTWIFASDTGMLLDEEATLIGEAGKLNVRAGSVISYTTFLESGWTSSTSSRSTS